MVYEPVVFPDAVAVVTTYLDSVLTEPVGNKVPNPRPTAFVVCDRVGGARRNLVVDDANVVVEAWAAADADAHDLAQLARAHVLSLPGQVVGGVPVYDVDELGGPGNQPDPLSGQSRYVFTVQVAVRGTAI
jgi:hypothetical protein